MTGSGQDAFSQLLYPMLSEQPSPPAALVDGLAAAPLEKAAESNRLRAQVLAEFEDGLVECGSEMAAGFQRGGTLLACGNGGSATTAACMVAEIYAPSPLFGSLRALCLTNDVAIVTAIANDVSNDDVFLRQVIAFGSASDILVGISTSGNSENVVRAIREARSRGMLAIGLTGYDGGRMAHELAPNHCFVVRSSSIHRIQEVQATIAHALWDVVHRQMEN